jgi:hypothetical protein
MTPFLLTVVDVGSFAGTARKLGGRATSVIGYSISIFGDGDAAGGLSPEY